VEALNIDGETFTTEGSGFYARALQHELDHLNGVLFVDHLSSLKRQLMRSALKRLKKEGEAWQKENS
jgi:peptide deformylase